MSAGYGRGYYGEQQLARAPRKRSWFTLVAVLGVGAAVVWLLWPRKATYDLASSGKEAERPAAPSASTSPLVVINTTSTPSPAISAPLVATGAFLKQVEDDARTRGYASVKDYEDSVIATAKQLQATGAKVMLAPHLQHLEAQLGS